MEEKIEGIEGDEQVVASVIKLQAFIRHHLQVAALHKMKETLNCVTILQKNIRNWNKDRDWGWYQVYGNVRPRLKRAKIREEISQLQDQLAKFEQAMKVESEEEEKLQKMLNEIKEDKKSLIEKLEAAKGNATTVEERFSKVKTMKSELEEKLKDMNNQLTQQEDETLEMQKQKQKVEQDYEYVQRTLEHMNASLNATEAEKKLKQEQIQSLRDELNRQDETIAKLIKEKKHEDERHRQLVEDLQAQETRTSRGDREKLKLEQAIDDLDDRIERERRNRQDKERQKKKTDGELKGTEEQIEHLKMVRRELDEKIAQKDATLHSLGAKFEEQGTYINRLVKQTKDNAQRIQELERELEGEHQTRQKSERHKNEMQREITETMERLEEDAGGTEAQIEINKKKNLEIMKLRRELEEVNISQENSLAGLRMEHNNAVSELNDELDRLRLEKAKLDKECKEVKNELEGVQSVLDAERKKTAEQERYVKTADIEMCELKKKYENQLLQIQELNSLKTRTVNENTHLQQQIDEMETQKTNLSRLKAHHNSRLQEIRQIVEEEAKQRKSVNGIIKMLNYEMEQLNEKIEIEKTNKIELRRILSKKNAEIQQWRARLQEAELVERKKLDELKQKQKEEVLQLKESLNATNSKIAVLEKVNKSLSNEIEDAHTNSQRHETTAVSLEKKNLETERVIESCRNKEYNLRSEIDATQKNIQNSNSEILKLKLANENLGEQVESLKRANKTLTQEMKNLKDQFNSDDRAVQQANKMVQRLSTEKQDLQKALSDAEDGLEIWAAKVAALQNDTEQTKAEIGRRFDEKDEEFESIRRNQQKAIDSVQASLDIEIKAKMDLMHQKKQLEMDINDLEIALDHANRLNVDVQKNIKQNMEQIKNLQRQLDEEQHIREEFDDNTISLKKRIAIVRAENEESMLNVLNLERAKDQQENDLRNFHEQIEEISSRNNNLNAMKQKLEGQIQSARDEMEDIVKEMKAADERSKKASADAARLSEELRQEREYGQHLERLRSGLELNLKTMQAKLENAEVSARKGSQHAVSEAEKRIKVIQQAIENEEARTQEALRTSSKQSRKYREIQFQHDEDQKSIVRLENLINKLHDKLNFQKTQLDESCSLVMMNEQKYRKMQMELENAEERVDIAENNLLRMRSPTRSGALVIARKAVISNEQQHTIDQKP